jgi:eukaryotic-like serine/threonine-protein kinase
MIGKVISHYRVLEKLGEGGMGVVYKAHDTKLDRTVALKFLPQHLTAHEPERSRFLQEAKAASALNHQNICTIHYLEEVDEKQFIVLEFVDGVTLRQKIPVQKIQDALGYAIQIGEALQEAHAKGIVHRDIKADNIMINSKNQVKVMDFGLAKLKGSMKLTKTSSTVGTLAYMAPEQLQGGDVDARSDIFSFGVVLYEMLAGRTPFSGEHEAAMMYSIVNEEPEPIEKCRSDLPATLVNVIQRMLEKDPADRFQTAADLVSELRRIQKQSARVVRQLLENDAESISESMKPSGIFSVTGKKVWIAVTLFAAIGVEIAYFTLMSRRSVELNPDMKMTTLQVPFTQIQYPGLSPDGNWVAFPGADANGEWQLYFMNTAGGDPRRITSDSSRFIFSAAVSPDGSQIVFNRLNRSTSKRELCIVSSLGGMSKVLVENPGGLARWRPDGQRIGYLRPTWMGSSSGRNEYWSIRPDGSDNRLEFVDSIGVGIVSGTFTYSQEGSSIAFIRRYPDPGNQELIVRNLITGKERQITNDQKNKLFVCWMPNDQIIFSSDKGGNINLWMVSSSGGEAVQITKGSGPDLSPIVSADGKKLLYYQRQQSDHIWVANMKQGTAHQITFDDRGVFNVVFSADAKRVAFGMYDPLLRAVSNIFVSDRDGANRQQVTFGEELAYVPLWSPDGKWIAYSSWSSQEHEDSARVYVLEASNPRTPKMVGRGFVDEWIDNTTFIAKNQNSSWITFVAGMPQKKFYGDSTTVLQLWAKGFTFQDERMGRDSTWFVPDNILKVLDKPDIIRSSRKPYDNYPKGWEVVAKSQDGNQYIYREDKSEELWRFSSPDGRKERLPANYPILRYPFAGRGTISYDGKEIVYVDGRVSGKLIMIENLFK